MAFFTKKGAERRKANRERRQNNRENRREHRREMRKIRQENQTERTRLRTGAKTEQAQIQAESDQVAYEMGITPIERQTTGGKIIDKVGNIVGGIFGGNRNDGFEDFTPVEDLGVNGIAPSNSGRSIMPLILIAAAALFILPKILKK